MFSPMGGDYFIIQADTIHQHAFVLAIDTIGDLTVWDTTTVSAAQKFYSITKGDSIELNASTDSSYDSSYWIDANGNLIADSLTHVWVHPTHNTYYVACLKICDSCCRFSYDTVLVKVLDPPIINLNIPTFITASNPKWFITSLPQRTQVLLYNILGQMIYKSSNYENDFSFIGLPSATYFYSLQFSNGEMQKGKVVWFNSPQ